MQTCNPYHPRYVERAESRRAHCEPFLRLCVYEQWACSGVSDGRLVPETPGGGDSGKGPDSSFRLGELSNKMQIVFIVEIAVLVIDTLEDDLADNPIRLIPLIFRNLECLDSGLRCAWSDAELGRGSLLGRDCPSHSDLGPRAQKVW